LRSSQSIQHQQADSDPFILLLTLIYSLIVPDDEPLIASMFSCLAVYIVDSLHPLRQTRWHGGQRSLADETMKALMNYHWANNVRELDTVIERAVTFAQVPTDD
jgi:hypothetical protein